MTTLHTIVTAAGLAKPVGFAHAVVAAPGRNVFLGGQAAQLPDGSIGGASLVDQFDIAAANVVKVIEAAGGRPEHLVSMHIYVTDVAEYHSWRHDLGRIYRSHFGHHYVASGLFAVEALFDPAAKVELICAAVIPDADGVA